MTMLAVALIIIGLFFLIVGSIGMLRLPNVFVRAHALSLTDSLGAVLVLAGLAVYQGFNVNFLKIMVVLVLVYLLNPAIAHATVRAAHRAGLRSSEGDKE
jgi:multicomponent Na+:H+ antiporter subunit G